MYDDKQFVNLLFFAQRLFTIVLNCWEQQENVKITRKWENDTRKYAKQAKG